MTEVRRQEPEKTSNPITSQLPSKSNRLTNPPDTLAGGGDRNRTDDLLLAKQALSQLSYTPSQIPAF